MRALALLLAASLTACGPQAEPAPDDLDGNLRWFWAKSDDAKDAEAVEAALKLETAGKAATLTADKPGRGFISRLTADELAVVGKQDVDPSKARGFFITNVFPCTLDKLEPILATLDQKTQYPEAYDAYARTYTSDADAFQARTASKLTWDVTLTAKLVTAPYTSNLKGGLRRITPASGATPFGPFLIARTWLTAPAMFKNPDPSTGFEQDYQIEVYWERAPGEMFHAYAMWRDLRLGLGFTTEDNGLANTIMTGLVDWDKRTAELCKK
jgi:hypothetical protein